MSLELLRWYLRKKREWFFSRLRSRISEPRRKVRQLNLKQDAYWVVGSIRKRFRMWPRLWAATAESFYS